MQDKPLGFSPDDRYRFVPQERIVKMLGMYGFSYTPDLDDAREYLEQKLDLWVSQGLPFKSGPGGERLFDSAEVYNFFKLASVKGQDDFCSTHLVPSHRRMVEDLAEHATDGECRLTLEFKRTFSLEGIAPGTKLRLRAPAPLGGKYLKEIETKAWIEAEAKAELHTSPGRLEARMTMGNDLAVTIGARFDFTSLKQEGNEGGEIDRELYLKDHEGLIMVTPKICEMAHSLATPGMPELKTIRAFWEHLNSEMIFGHIHYDQIDMSRPSEWIAEHGWFDCQTGAALFASLCRASGIPARIVCGYLLPQRVPIKHYWMEAWLEDSGWTPFDLMSWDLSEGGRDIRWRDRFFGKIDYRLMLERMPREFMGALGLPMPEAWTLLPGLESGVVECHFYNINGSLLYSDFMRISS